MRNISAGVVLAMSGFDPLVSIPVTGAILFQQPVAALVGQAYAAKKGRNCLSLRGCVSLAQGIASVLQHRGYVELVLAPREAFAASYTLLSVFSLFLVFVPELLSIPAKPHR